MQTEEFVKAGYFNIYSVCFKLLSDSCLSFHQGLPASIKCVALF